MPRREEEPPCLGVGTGLPAKLRKESSLLPTSGSCCVCSPWPSSGALNNCKRKVKGSPLPGTHLVAGGTAGSEELGVVPAAVDPPILLEVDEVHQRLVAEVAGEAGRVPELVPQPGCRNPWVPFVQPPAALQGRGTWVLGSGWLLGTGPRWGMGAAQCWGEEGGMSHLLAGTAMAGTWHGTRQPLPQRLPSPSGAECA